MSDRSEDLPTHIHRSPTRRRLKKAQKRLTELREKLYLSRLRLKEKRNELRDEREMLIGLEAKSMDLLRHFWERGTTPDQLAFETLYHDLLAKKDSVGMLQYEYDQAEGDHDTVEAELDKEEESFFSSVPGLEPRSGPDKEEASSSSSETPPRTETSSHSKETKQAQNLYKQYQSRLGDAKIVRERIQELVLDYHQSSNFARVREKVGLGTKTEEPPEDIALAYSTMVRELNMIQDDVELRKQHAVKAGCGISGHVVPNIPTLDLPTRSNTRPSQDKSSTPTHQSDSALLYLHKNFTSARSRINTWILHRLESSSVEHARHKTILSAMRDDSMDDEQWARYVLEYWKIDDLGEGESTSSGSWENIGPPKRTKKEINSNFSSLYVLLYPRASRAVDEYNNQFPSSNRSIIGLNKPSIPTSRDRATPYEAVLDLDVLSEYESRSV
ncbi:hypothetical protein MMC24_000806 [Lignoscripta atroalba]|nr:hypothetical protein [Lignoscripta atroalba]